MQRSGIHLSFDVQVVRVQTVIEDACGTLLKISGLRVRRGWRLQKATAHCIFPQ
jgi:hypothetical protein